jgi:hypothetical protein
MNNDSCSCGSITPLFTRRDILKSFSCGFGWVAFRGARAEGCGGDGRRSARAEADAFSGARETRHLLTMRGGPSHVDTFDYKPKLTADNDKPGRRPGTRLLGSKWKFTPSGKSGLQISELFPNIRQARRRDCASSVRCRPICRATRRRF